MQNTCIHKVYNFSKVTCISTDTVRRPCKDGVVFASLHFLAKNKKAPYLERAVRKLDTLKVLLLVLWETKSIDNKKYIALSMKVDEVGRMLGGWRGQLTKNSPEA